MGADTQILLLPSSISILLFMLKEILFTSTVLIIMQLIFVRYFVIQLQ
jgi:hypothetical protein